MIETLAILAGFGMLIWGADQFVAGAAGLARTLKVSTLIIGLVIVGFGTSAPEMLVAGFAGWEGNTGLAIGNALGSNITNIALVLGVTALISPLAVHSKLLRREFPVLFLIMALTVVLLFDGDLSRLDGIILLGGLVAFIGWMIHLGKKGEEGEHDPMEAEFAEELPEKLPLKSAMMWLIIGLITLLVGARLVVWGAVAIAQSFGISDLIIGLTVVAIGTSLPELATTIASARKGEDDIAIGNIIGSNMFNLLGVLGIPAVIHPDIFESSVLTRDIPVMIGLTIVLFLMARSRNKTPGKISRAAGAGLALAYAAYLFLLYTMTT